MPFTFYVHTGLHCGYDMFGYIGKMVKTLGLGQHGLIDKIISAKIRYRSGDRVYEVQTVPGKCHTGEICPKTELFKLACASRQTIGSSQN